jgi:hypothetical protein
MCTLLDQCHYRGAGTPPSACIEVRSSLVRLKKPCEGSLAPSGAHRAWKRCTATVPSLYVSANACWLGAVPWLPAAAPAAPAAMDTTMPVATAPVPPQKLSAKRGALGVPSSMSNANSVEFCVAGVAAAMNV